MSGHNPHRARFWRPSADEMRQREKDGFYEDGPPEDQPDWYRRARASRARKIAKQRAAKAAEGEE